MQSVYQVWKERVVRGGVNLIQHNIFCSIVDDDKYPHNPSHNFDEPVEVFCNMEHIIYKYLPDYFLLTQKLKGKKFKKDVFYADDLVFPKDLPGGMFVGVLLWEIGDQGKLPFLYFPADIMGGSTVSEWDQVKELTIQWSKKGIMELILPTYLSFFQRILRRIGLWIKF